VSPQHDRRERERDPALLEMTVPSVLLAAFTAVAVLAMAHHQPAA
jgi:hypothetical protein